MKTLLLSLLLLATPCFGQGVHIVVGGGGSITTYSNNIFSVNPSQIYPPISGEIVTSNSLSGQWNYGQIFGVPNFLTSVNSNNISGQINYGQIYGTPNVTVNSNSFTGQLNYGQIYGDNSAYNATNGFPWLSLSDASGASILASNALTSALILTNTAIQSQIVVSSNQSLTAATNSAAGTALALVNTTSNSIVANDLVADAATGATITNYIILVTNQTYVAATNEAANASNISSGTINSNRISSVTATTVVGVVPTNNLPVLSAMNGSVTASQLPFQQMLLITPSSSALNLASGETLFLIGTAGTSPGGGQFTPGQNYVGRTLSNIWLYLTVNIGNTNLDAYYKTNGIQMGLPYLHLIGSTTIGTNSIGSGVVAPGVTNIAFVISNEANTATINVRPFANSQIQ